MLKMLDRCHKLQSLTIQICNHHYELYDGERWKDPPNVPDCLSSQLRICCLTGYEGGKVQLPFAKYILQNSKVLNTMTIKCSNIVDMNAKQKMLMELTSFKRGSETCKLLFD
ncbi:unnamed protein product [Trifolium pratense]|uniref:Uncharacterized protein n=1 Tax=Trifolium pratense TaxID=57577 RepID=A0ACB0J4B2_TRIPR|nr:unnamed protein product [Trifolium pratense]